MGKKRFVRRHIGHDYLYTGYTRLNEKGRLEIVNGSLEPVENTFVLTQDPTVTQKYGLAVWRTDGKGLLHLADPTKGKRDSAPHLGAREQRFFLPPVSVLLLTKAADKTAWPKILSKIFLGDYASREPGAKSKPFKDVLLTKLPFYKESLKAPDDESTEMYKNFYQRQKSKKWHKDNDRQPKRAFVLSKTRGIVLVFSDTKLDIRQIDVTAPQDKNHRDIERFIVDKKTIFRASDEAYASVFGPPEKMKAGIYTVEVHLEDAPKGKWNEQVTAAKSYRLSDKLNFNIVNLAGEFDIINCDPISLEESVLTQFPDRFTHLIKEAGDQNIYDPEAEKPKGAAARFVEQWSNRIKWSSEKVKLASKLADADGVRKRSSVVGRALFEAIPDDDPHLKPTREAIALAFSAKEAVGDWRTIIANVRADRELSNVKDFLYKELNDRFEADSRYKYIREEYLKKEDAKLMHIKDLSDEELGEFLGKNARPKKSELERAFGKKAEKAILFAYDALSYVDTYLSLSKATKLADKLESFRHHFEDLLKQYQEHFDADARQSPMREGMLTLEKYRRAVLLAEMNLTAEQLNAFLCFLDSALGTLCLVPGVGEMAQFILVVKTTLVLLKDAVCLMADLIDSVFLSNQLAEWSEVQKMQQQMLDAALNNSKAMATWQVEEGGRDDMEVQWRLRAQTLDGLMLLLLRASMSQDCVGESEEQTHDKYIAKLQDYGIEKYIEQFVLQDGWVLSADLVGVVNIYTHWIYDYKLRKKHRDSDLREWYLEKADESQIGSGRPFMAAFKKGYKAEGRAVIANFHKYFPIHGLANESWKELAALFKPSFSEVEKDWIEHTCVYVRPKESTDEADWRPLNPEAKDDVDELPVLSPLDALRVLVVMDQKKTKEGIYPAKLALKRVDGWNLDGPEYAGVVKTLGPELIAGEESFKGRLGCVFHPFYKFFGQTLLGTKPLGSSWSVGLGAHLYYYRGKLSDMRYAFELQVGGKESEQWVKLQNLKDKKSDLDEYAVSFDLKKEPELRKMLIPSFLTSGTTEVEYPRLAVSTGVGPCFVRAGDSGPYRLPDRDSGGEVVFDPFDWNQPVEFILIVWALGIHVKDFKAAGVDWKSLPINLSLGNDKVGPSYPAKMEYIGRYNTQGQVLMPSCADKKLDRLIDQLKDRRHLDLFEHQIHPVSFADLFRDDVYKLYGIYLRPHYYDFEGRRREGLRPFADSMLEADEYYRYALVNIQAPPKLEVRADKVKVADFDDLEFRFRAPKDHTKNVPWANANVSKQEIEAWITQRPKDLRAKVEL